MRSLRFLPVLLGGLLCLLIGSQARAYSFKQRVGPIEIQQEALLSSNANSVGYVFYRFRIKNLDTSTRHWVRLTLRGSVTRSFHLRKISRQVVVDKGRVVSVELFVPPVQLYAAQVEVSVDGGQQVREISLNATSRLGHSYYRSDHNKVVFVSQGVGRRVVEALRKAKTDYRKGHNALFKMLTEYHAARRARARAHRAVGRKGYTRGGKHPARILAAMKLKQKVEQLVWGNMNVVSSALSLDAWPGQWLAYSSFHMVTVTGKELNKASAETIEALGQFVEVGGFLFVVGRWSPPARWTRISKSKVVSDWREFGVGFGRVLIFDPGATGLVSGPTSRLTKTSTQVFPIALLGRLLEISRDSAKPWYRLRNIREANRIFPIVDNLSIPVRGIFLMMLVFSILIGPVSLRVLARRGRRLSLLWVAPLISAVMCVLIFGYAFVTEGWHGNGRVWSITLLDQTSHRAISLGWAAYYMPLTPSEGLHFGNETCLTPQLRTYWREPGRGLEMNMDRDQHLSSGWAVSRVPVHFRFRKNQLRRERIAVRKEGERLSIVNGLGAPIKKLWLVDKSGRVHFAENVPAGARSQLQDSGKTVTTNASVLRKLYVESELPVNVKRAPQAFLFPGAYVALLKGAPFVERAAAVKKMRANSMVVGLLKGATDGR